MGDCQSCLRVPNKKQTLQVQLKKPPQNKNIPDDQD